jgi:type 1 glutamine amidotransferase/HEAT repeat protein
MCCKDQTVNRIMLKRCLILVLICWAVCAAAVTEEEVEKMQAASPSVCVAEPRAARHLLVFNRCDGFPHTSIAYWDKALEIMGQKTGAFKVSTSSDMSVFETAKLDAYDAICFNNTTGLTFTEAQKKALMSFVENGKGLVGIHAATDNFKGWPEASTMIGGTFTGHPWGSGGTWAVKIDDPNHPLMASFSGSGFEINDEIYRTDPPFYDRSKQRVLMSLDLSDAATGDAEGIKDSDWDTGLSWVKTVGKGRVFYGSLGHNHHIAWNHAILVHYLAGIQFALGDLDVDTAPLENLDWDAVAAVLTQVAKYDYAASRDALTRLEKMTRKATQHPKDQRRLEELLVPMLTQDISMAAKDFVCRQLRLIGSDASVPALLTLLPDPNTEYMARMVLESIPGKAVDQRLRAALPNMPAAVQVGIIATLGRRGDDRSVSALATFVTEEDETLALNAIRALGSIGSNDALSALNMAKDEVKGPVKTELLHALLQCGDNMVAASQIDQAVSLYETLMTSDYPNPIRMAALQGLAEAEPGKIAERVTVIMTEQDDVLMGPALSLVSRLNDPVQIKRVAARMNALSQADQILLLSALSRTRQKAALETVKQTVASDQEPVRVAALMALGKLGDASCVELLAQYAGRRTSRAIQSAARASLNQLYSDEVDAEIVRLLAQTQDPVVRVALLRAVADRQMTDALSGVRLALDDGNRVVKSEALKTLSVLGGEADLTLLVSHLIKAPQRALEDAIVVVAQRVGLAESVSQDLVKKVASASPTIQMSVLRILSRLGEAAGLAYIEAQCESANDRVKTEAVRALSNWPDRAGLSLAAKLAQEGDSMTCRILALRGYIKMAVMASDSTPADRFKGLAKAMTLATRDDERKMVLSALPQIPCKEALSMSLSYVRDASLTAEAQAAVMDLCEALRDTDTEAVRAALVKMSNGKVNATIKDRISKLQQQVK